MNTINDRIDKARESNLVDKSVREENKMQNGEDHKTKREKEIHIEIILVFILNGTQERGTNKN